MFIDWALPLLASQKYWILFLLFLIEGPITNIVASILAVSGVFNIWIIIPLAIVGNVLGDIIHYLIGTRMSNIRFNRKLQRLGDKSIFSELERLLNTNFYKSLFIIKIIPAFSSVGLLYIGKKRYPFGKFLVGSILIELVVATTISFLGYVVIGNIAKYLYYFDIYEQIALYAAIVAILGFIIWYYRRNIRSWFYRTTLRSKL
ncbi:MAG: VTT domain-containing protein [archaeon]